MPYFQVNSVNHRTADPDAAWVMFKVLDHQYWWLADGHIMIGKEEIASKKLLAWYLLGG